MTGTDVFTITMALSDDLVDGLADNPGTAAYKARSIALINMLGQELCPFSDTPETAAGRQVFSAITDLDDALELDAGLVTAVMPHGLAALLFADENPAKAQYHEQKYLEKKAQFRSFPRMWEDIEDIYGIGGYDGACADE